MRGRRKSDHPGDLSAALSAASAHSCLSSKQKERKNDRAILSRCERRLKPQTDDKMSHLWVFIVN